MTNAPLPDTVNDGIDRAARQIDHAIDSGRGLADRAAVEVHGRLQHLQAELGPRLERFEHAAGDALGQVADRTRAGIGHAREAGERVSDEAAALTAGALRYVRARPLRSMLIAAGIGAAIVVAVRLMAGPHARH